jgi:hypothetical protein
MQPAMLQICCSYEKLLLLLLLLVRSASLSVPTLLPSNSIAVCFIAA